MKAATVRKFGGPEVIEILDVPAPTTGAGEVLVRVHASALNRADLLQRTGRYAAPPGWPADILGMEIAGEVEALGAGVTQFKKGDRVFGIVGGGAHAEFCVTRASQLTRAPSGLDWVQLAAVPEAFTTAHDALMQAQFRAGDRVLIHAVGSGVGIAAVQLVKALGGIAFGTARSAEKVERARAFGLANGIVVGGELASLPPVVRGWTDDAGVNVILNLVGGPYLAADIDCAAKQARIMLIGLTAGRAASQLDLGVVLNKRLTIRGTVLRSRSDEEKAAVTAAFARDVVPLIESGAVKPVVDRTFPLAQLADAHRLMESNATFGKIVVTH